MSYNYAFADVSVVERGFYLIDDFTDGITAVTGLIGETGWVVTSVGTTTVSAGNITSGRVGVKRLITGGSNGNQWILGRNFGIDNTFPIWDLVWIFKAIETVSVTRRAGFSDSISGAPFDGAYFEKLNTDSNWFSVTNKSGVSERQDTGIADNTSYHTFRIRRPDDQSFEFYIDSQLQTTHTDQTKFPGGGFGLNPILSCTTAANAAKSIDIDRAMVKITGVLE